MDITSFARVHRIVQVFPLNILNKQQNGFKICLCQAKITKKKG